MAQAVLPAPDFDHDGDPGDDIIAIQAEIETLLALVEFASESKDGLDADACKGLLYFLLHMRAQAERVQEAMRERIVTDHMDGLSG